MVTDSNSVVTMSINIPEHFMGNHVEIFSKDNLVYTTNWSVAANWLPSYGSPSVTWEDPFLEQRKYATTLLRMPTKTMTETDTQTAGNNISSDQTRPTSMFAMAIATTCTTGTRKFCSVI
jgi:hypothetical protein